MALFYSVLQKHNPVGQNYCLNRFATDDNRIMISAQLMITELRSVGRWLQVFPRHLLHELEEHLRAWNRRSLRSSTPQRPTGTALLRGVPKLSSLPEFPSEASQSLKPRQRPTRPGLALLLMLCALMETPWTQPTEGADERSTPKE